MHFKEVVFEVAISKTPVRIKGEKFILKTTLDVFRTSGEHESVKRRGFYKVIAVIVNDGHIYKIVPRTSSMVTLNEEDTLKVFNETLIKHNVLDQFLEDQPIMARSLGLHKPSDTNTE